MKTKYGQRLSHNTTKVTSVQQFIYGIQKRAAERTLLDDVEISSCPDCKQIMEDCMCVL